MSRDPLLEKIVIEGTEIKAVLETTYLVKYSLLNKKRTRK